MRKLIMCTFLVIFLIVFLVVPVVQASHYIYWAEDPTQDDPRSTLRDNFVLVWWWWGLNVQWWADPAAAGGQFIQEVRTATENWDNAIFSYKEWKEVTDPAQADIKFLYVSQPCSGEPQDNCIPCAGDVGCATPMAWENRTPPNGYENAKIGIAISISLASAIPRIRSAAEASSCPTASSNKKLDST